MDEKIKTDSQKTNEKSPLDEKEMVALVAR